MSCTSAEEGRKTVRGMHKARRATWKRVAQLLASARRLPASANLVRARAGEAVGGGVATVTVKGLAFAVVGGEEDECGRPAAAAATAPTIATFERLFNVN